MSLEVMQLNNSHISTSTRSPVVSRRLTVADHPQLRDRFAARWRSGALDRALAAGVSPESTPALALRARRLSELSQRRRVADGLRGLIAEGLGPQSPTDPRILPNRTALRAARAELEQLADALAKPGPVSPHGVAQARIARRRASRTRSRERLTAS
jgi:hypothetical protein